MKNFKYLNSSSFSGGNTVPLYQVYDNETGEIYYESHIFGRTARGAVSITQKFSDPVKTKVLAWRESHGKNK